MSNKEDKRIGKTALGHTPVNKWGRKKANKKSRAKAKKALASSQS